PEPEIVQSWRPGKIFRLKPGDENWMEVLKDAVPPELDMHINRFFNEIHTYHHSIDGDDFTVTIEGNPNKNDSKVTVQAGDDEYETTVGDIDKLPEKYREPAEQAVKEAQKDVETRKPFRMPEWNLYLNKIRPYQDFQIPSFEPGGPMFDRIQKQMEQLQRRLDRLEKRWEKPQDSDKPPKQESEKEQKKIPLEQGDKKSV
ncbi:MAG: hypothetical protein JXM79_20950, partial [Sedimentisphaerales bacterium]|nr:hypothetical protein [Sedimentisphaerales bacterium]